MPDGYDYTTDPDFLSASAIDQKNYLMHADSDFAKSKPEDQAAYLIHLKGLDKPTQFEQERQGATKFWGSTAGQALGGTTEGLAEGIGIPVSQNPIKDIASGLYRQGKEVVSNPLLAPLIGGAIAAKGLYQTAKNIPTGIQQSYQGIKQGDVEGATRGAAKAIASGYMLGSTAKGAVDMGNVPTEEPSTMGMKYGGTTAQIERIANRIPVSSAPLKKVYSQVADNFKSTVSDAVEKVSGIKANPEDLVGSLNDGAQSLKNQSKSFYAPVDEYIKTNNVDMVNRVVKALQADPEMLRNLPDQVYSHPINGIKQAIDVLEQKGKSAISNRPIEANSYFQRAQEMQGVLDQITNSLPPDMKSSYQQAQSLYATHAAMKDIADTFDKSIEGLPPNRLPTGLAKTSQPIKASSLLENLKSEPRLRQAFGPDLANAIVDHAARLSSAQALQGGAAGSIAGGLYGTSLLARAFTGYGVTTIPVELSGIYALSKVLATPAAHPFYAQMLRATSIGAQEMWAKQAVLAAMQNQKGKK